jgi:hypothetical protein
MKKWKRLPGFWIAIATLTAWQLGGGVSAAQPPLEAPWQHTDIGNVGIAGSASESSDADLIINAADSDIWGTADSFHFVYQTMYDGQITSNSPSLQNTNPFAKVGLMIRLTLDPGSPEVIVDVKPDHRDRSLRTNQPVRAIFDANDGATLLTGYTRRELLSMSVWDLTVDDAAAAGQRMWQAFLEAGTLAGDYDVRQRGCSRVPLV